MSPKNYMQLLFNKGITPNWWCSEEYFEYAEFKIKQIDNYIIVQDVHKEQIFPSISLKDNIVFGKNNNGFWCGFKEKNGNEFLDFEYIYDPRDFLNMKGGKWQTFRKNIRKFQNRLNENTIYIKELPSRNNIEHLLYDWCESIEEMQDYEVLISYCFEGKNRMFLVGEQSNKLYGINVWDENFKYINYRYCICKNIDFLSEYLRYLFYTNVVKIGKLVNDGGSLGRESLKKFKEKLNPIEINNIYSEF